MPVLSGNIIVWYSMIISAAPDFDDDVPQFATTVTSTNAEDQQDNKSDTEPEEEQETEEDSDREDEGLPADQRIAHLQQKNLELKTKMRSLVKNIGTKICNKALTIYQRNIRIFWKSNVPACLRKPRK